ncbi:MAG: hypothetical protein ACYCSZ_07165 [Burkholderiales bacterium]
MKSDFTTAPHALALDKGAASSTVQKSTTALHTKNLISPMFERAIEKFNLHKFWPLVILILAVWFRQFTAGSPMVLYR